MHNHLTLLSACSRLLASSRAKAQADMMYSPEVVEQQPLGETARFTQLDPLVARVQRPGNPATTCRDFKKLKQRQGMG